MTRGGKSAETIAKLAVDMKAVALFDTAMRDGHRDRLAARIKVDQEMARIAHMWADVKAHEDKPDSGVA